MDTKDGLGKRESNKRATRAALQAAADQLFTERGFAQTTVQDIAAAAGVTQRTFFRYFATKEELIVDEALSWLPRLCDAIVERPAEERPITAVGRALIAVAADVEATGRPTPSWIFSAGPPAEKLRRSGNLLLVIEQAVADALCRRHGTPPTVREVFGCEVAARAAVSAARSALLRDARLRHEGRDDAPTHAELLAQAFADLGAGDIRTHER